MLFEVLKVTVSPKIILRSNWLLLSLPYILNSCPARWSISERDRIPM